MESKQKKDSKETSKPNVLYNKEWNDYAYWNGSQYVAKIVGANFYTLEKAANNGYLPLNSIREQALAWWNSLLVFGIPSKEYYIGLYYSDDIVTPERIEEIWKKETQVAYCEKVTCNNSDCKSGCKELKYRNKSNQKQSPADEIIELVGEDNFKQIIKESDKRVNQKQYPEETFGLASETTTREQAIAYFNSLPSVDQQMLTDRYFNERHRQSLTGREIEEIYNKEVLEPKRQKEWQEFQVNCKYTKPNAKEFKQFDESLFKAYIDKFSNEDKLKAINCLGGFTIDQTIRAYSCGYGDRDANLPQFHGEKPVNYLNKLKH